MPVQTYTLPPDTARKIKRKIKDLLRRSVLPVNPNDYRVYKPGFCMPVQLIPKKQVDSLKFGKAEGFRIFIQQGINVLAAVDFTYSKTQLITTAIHQGQGLQTLLKALNKLEKKFKLQKQACYPELIYFLLTPGVYFKVSAGRQVTYFHYHKERLTTISAKRLQNQVLSIINHHQKA